MSRPLESQHGTPARYRWHLRHGHKPVARHCPPCAQAEAIRQAEKRERLGYVWFQPAYMWVRTR